MPDARILRPVRSAGPDGDGDGGGDGAAEAAVGRPFLRLGLRALWDRLT